MDLERKEAMPSDVQVILGWPICRTSRAFSLDGMDGTYWHPYSAEKLVEMARKWYWAGEVPDDWRQRLLTSLSEDEEFTKLDGLQTFIANPYPMYYRCPRCSFYV